MTEEDALEIQAANLVGWWTGFYQRGGVLLLTNYRLMQPADEVASGIAYERFRTEQACLIGAALKDLAGVFSTLDGGAARTQAHLDHVVREEAARLRGEDDGA